MKIELELIDPIVNANKFYNIEIYKVNGKEEIKVQYGRIGKRTRSTKIYNDKDLNFYHKLLSSKLKKGYEVKSSSDINFESTIDNKVKKKIKKTLNKKEIIDRFDYDLDNDFTFL